ncbi:MAG: YvcK family protein [archaeon]|nr:YvcK family protein [archaeon]
MKQQEIVTIGGGTGTFTVLSGLKHYPVNLRAVVAMADDGGSTKILREEFGVLPPGSVRPALVALSDTEEYLSDLLNFRFEEGSLEGHNMGNILITALTKQLGSFEEAMKAAGKILQIKGEVIPSTLKDVTLVAKLENGKTIKGEDNVDEPKHNGDLKIKDAWLEPACRANPRAIEGIKKADVVVIGPGDLFSSIIPNFLAKGMKRALQQSKAKKIYICNIMTKHGETTGFAASDFVETLEQYIGEDVLDCIVVNTKAPSSQRVKKYEKEGSETVEYDIEKLRQKGLQVIEADLLRARGFVRHDPDILAKTLFSIS